MGVHRAKDVTAGSFTYWNNVTYVATCDIVEGEELTVECSDENYESGAYYLSRYKPDIAEKELLCVLSIEVRTGYCGNGIAVSRSERRIKGHFF